MHKNTINVLLLQTGIFLEELPLTPELGDYISSKASAVDLFDRAVAFEKDAGLSHVWNTGRAKCTLCAQDFKVEGIVDLYEHLSEKHTQNFIKCMILMDLLVDHVIEDDIRFVKEEVKAVATITNCMGFGRGVLSDRVRYMVKRKSRDIVDNRLDSKVFANENVLNSFLSKVENFLQEPIVPFVMRADNQHR